jgi:hypothetical protein
MVVGRVVVMWFLVGGVKLPLWCGWHSVRANLGGMWVGRNVCFVSLD